MILCVVQFVVDGSVCTGSCVYNRSVPQVHMCDEIVAISGTSFAATS